MRKKAFLIALFLVIVGTVTMHDTNVRDPAQRFAFTGTGFDIAYCAGEVTAGAAEPYARGALLECERRLRPELSVFSARNAESPMPGYDLAGFALLSLLPYAAAKIVFLAVLVAALLCATWYLAEIARLPSFVVFVAVALGGGYLPLANGRLTPVVVAALAAAAYYAERRRTAPLIAALAIAMIEPRFGAAAALASFVWLPRTRWALAYVCGTLAVLSVLAVGYAQSIAYFTRFVPERALGEFSAVNQFSMAHVFHVFGSGDAVAMRAGTISAVLAVALGLLAARHAQRILASDAVLIAIPPAAALLGGSSVHEMQLAMAFPAAFVLATRATSGRAVAWFALITLAFPWFSLSTAAYGELAPAFGIALCAAAALAYSGSRAFSTLSRVILACGAAMCCVTLVLAFRHLPGTAFVRAGASPLRTVNAAEASSWRSESEKIPSWLALLGLITVAAAQHRPKQRRVTDGLAVAPQPVL